MITKRLTEYVKAFIQKIKVVVVAQSIIVWDGTKKFGNAIKREVHETRFASKIFVKIVKRIEVTPTEIKYLKDQAVDLCKAVAIVGLKVIPGALIAVIAIEKKLGKKYGFTLFPKEQIMPEQEKRENTEAQICEGKENDDQTNT